MIYFLNKTTQTWHVVIQAGPRIDAGPRIHNRRTGHFSRGGGLEITCPQKMTVTSKEHKVIT